MRHITSERISNLSTNERIRGGESDEIERTYKNG